MAAFEPSARQDELAALVAAHSPLTVDWSVDVPIVRVHSNRHGPADFYAGGDARFNPFLPMKRPGSARRGSVAARVPDPLAVLYGSDKELGALSETVFRDLPLKGSKSIARSALVRKNMSTLVATRPLHLADLRQLGLRHMQLSRKQVIEGDRRSYTHTRLLAQAIHDLGSDYDGLLWISRQDDTSQAVMLFGDRVADEDIDTSPDVPTYPLATGHGRARVDEIADLIGMTIVDP